MYSEDGGETAKQDKYIKTHLITARSRPYVMGEKLNQLLRQHYPHHLLLLPTTRTKTASRVTETRIQYFVFAFQENPYSLLACFINHTSDGVC